MALTLQDLLTTTTDVNASQTARFAASRSQSSRVQHDPFADFFKNATGAQDNSASQNAISSSQTNESSDVKSGNADAKSDTSDSSKTADNAKSKQTTAKRVDGHPHHHSEKRSNTDSAKTAVKPAADLPAQAANATPDAGQDTTANAGADTTAATNLFQVTLIASQANGTAASTTSQDTPAIDATSATAPANGTDNTNPAPISSGDISALLALQEETSAPTQAVMPGAIANAPAQSGQNIAIAVAAPTSAAKAAISPASAQPRNSDSGSAKGNTATQGALKGSAQTDASRPEQQPDDSGLGKTATPDKSANPVDKAAADITQTTIDPSAIPTVSANADVSAQAPDNSDQTGTSQNAPAAITPPAAGIANPQQVQALYSQASDRNDSLPQVTIDQVTMRLTKAADDGLDHLTIHLKPVELGSIEIKLEMGDNGISKATISADRQDTLNLLQKDSHRLEQALENAGVKTDSASLSFNLRSDGGERQMQNFFQRQGGYSPSTPSYSSRSFDEGSLPEAATIVGYLNSRAALGGVDIRV